MIVSPLANARASGGEGDGDDDDGAKAATARANDVDGRGARGARGRDGRRERERATRDVARHRRGTTIGGTTIGRGRRAARSDVEARRRRRESSKDWSGDGTISITAVWGA